LRHLDRGLQGGGGSAREIGGVQDASESRHGAYLTMSPCRASRRCARCWASSRTRSRAASSGRPIAAPTSCRPTPCPPAAATAIYYLLTPDTVSAMHRLATDEIFHFYLGDPVEMLQLRPDGSHRVAILGPDLDAGQRPQIVVPRGVWQGARLVPGGRFALLGTTVAPGFDYADYETG